MTKRERKEQKQDKKKTGETGERTKRKETERKVEEARGIVKEEGRIQVEGDR